MLGGGDAPDYMLNLPLGLVTVAGITRPVPADLEQLPNVIAQGTFKVSQICSKSHPQSLR
jgi:hypothetical protein